MENKQVINVIDSIMGSGKSQYFIEYIKNNPDKKFIYITPYLNEIKRMKEATKDTNKMYEPTYYNKTNKQDDFHKLLSEGKNICSTHALFKKANDFTRKALKSNNYILILDEVMDVVEEMKDFTECDFDMLIQQDLAYVEDDYLKWNKDKDKYKGRYDDIKTMAENNNLISIGKKLLFWNFPVDIFNYFKETYVLTYQFDCQIQRYYYDFHNVKYKKFQIDDNYNMVSYSESLYDSRRFKLNPLVNIFMNDDYNSIGDDKTDLSLSWYNKYPNILPILQSNLYNWFNNGNARKIKNDKKLWTTFKTYQKDIKGKGYTKRFIPLNVRATNDYREAMRLAYCCNRFLRPTIKLFFTNKGININEDQYALSEMLQWIWRSRIRQGQNIDVYIPSKRMRNLLIEYLQPKIK